MPSNSHGLSRKSSTKTRPGGYEWRVKYERGGGVFDSGPWVSEAVARDVVRRHELTGTTAWVERRQVEEWERVDA